MRVGGSILISNQARTYLLGGPERGAGRGGGGRRVIEQHANETAHETHVREINKKSFSETMAGQWRTFRDAPRSPQFHVH